MLASVDSPKAEPGDVARAVLDGIESGSGHRPRPALLRSVSRLESKDPKALGQQLAAY
jgi:hypothetical protein